MAEQLYQRLLLPASFFLPRFDCDIAFTVIWNRSSIAEAVNVVFENEIVGVNKSFSSCRKADVNAACIFFFALALCQWFIANRAFRLGVTAGTLTIKKGSLDNVDSFIDSFSYLHIARWNTGSHLNNLLQLGYEVLGVDSAFGQVFHVGIDK